MTRLHLRKHQFNRRGFTLVELLAVIVVVAILAVLLFAGFNAYLEKANGVKCLSNMCTLEMSSERWSADNGGRIMPSLMKTGVGWAPWNFILMGYGGAGEPYLNDYTILQCPTYAREFHPGTSLYAGYGRSYILSGSDGVIDFSGAHFNGNARMTQIIRPARTVSFYEINPQYYNADAYGGCPVDGEQSFYYQFIGRHGNGFYLSFFDGHAEWVSMNTAGQFHGYYASDYPQFIWKPY